MNAYMREREREISFIYLFDCILTSYGLSNPEIKLISKCLTIIITSIFFFENCVLFVEKNLFARLYRLSFPRTINYALLDNFNFSYQMKRICMHVHFPFF